MSVVDRHPRSVNDPQLQLDLDGSHATDIPFSEWIRSLPPTPWSLNECAPPASGTPRIEAHG